MVIPVSSAGSPGVFPDGGGPAVAETRALTVGGRFASEIRRGVAAFQRDGDGWGVTAVVDRARPAAFSCDQDLVLRQAMADRGWSVPQFVAGPPDGGAEGVELPRHSAVEALGGVPAEPPSRRVWHVSTAGVAPLPPPPGVGRPEMAVRIVRAVARSAGVELAEGGSVSVAPSVSGRGVRCVVPCPAAASSDGVEWSSRVLRTVVETLARSRVVNQVVQLFSFERFVVRAMCPREGCDGVLAAAYWSVAESLARAHSVKLAPGCGERLLYEPRTRTLVAAGGAPGVRRSLAALFQVAEATGHQPAAAAAVRRDVVALLRASGVGGPVSRPDRVEPRDGDGRAALVAAIAAKRVADRLGLPYVAGAFSPGFTASALRVLHAEGWRSVAVEAGNLAGWLVDSGRGRAPWPAALE
ncbi:MAG: hypothetical protein OXH69_18720 [Acidobacteria bacterium]|nr:hypothetical protein [Acidobacteriota bacterium]